MKMNKALIQPILLIVLLTCAPHGVLWAGDNPFGDFFKRVFTVAQPKGDQPATETNLKPTQQSRQASLPSITGTVKKGSNIRSGPGTKNAKVALLPKGTTVNILKTTGNWYSIQANADGVPINGWIYSPLVEIDSTPRPTDVITSIPQGPAATRIAGSDQSSVTYAGYSKEFLPVKRMMEQGDLKGVEKFYTEKEAEARKNNPDNNDLIGSIGFLRWLERGTLSLDQGDFQNSEKDFSFAERLLEERQRQSKAEDWLKIALGVIGDTVAGQSLLNDYAGVGYERVLMLNYKSIAYLLQGERKAYNVARRAIDWQNMEKKAFDAEQRKLEQELTEQRKDQAKEENGESNPIFDAGITQNYARMNAKAATVPSAYVNPFGYYVAGMIQEYESYNDWSLRDNARISYSKALELNPGSKVLKKAVKDMKSRKAPSGTRLVHVVVADGFVPEKKMLTYNIPTQAGNIPIKLTIYEPVPTLVDRIEVQTAGGKRLAMLSPVADVEAICLRHQKDQEPFRYLKVALAVGTSVVIKGAAQQFGGIGQWLSAKREEMTVPDMRSWMSLPATIQAARLRLKKGVSKLKIVTYDKKGRRLASRIVKIKKNAHDFVYTRSLDKQMYAYSAKDLWMLAGR